MNKQIIKYFGLVLTLVATFVSCTEADKLKNVVYFTGTETSTTTKISVEGNTDMGLTITAANLVSQDVTVHLKSSPELVEAYNKANGKEYKALPTEYFNLSNDKVKISNGHNVSDAVALAITDVDSFEEGVTYCLPLSIAQVEGGLQALQSSKTMYVVINKTLITSAVRLSRTGIHVPFSDDESLNSVPQVSFETKFKADSWCDSSPYISTLMGLEENFLIRFGDVTIKKNQIQLAGGGYQLTSPMEFSADQWYHVALTYDGAKLRFYINGKLNCSLDAPRGNINLADTYSGGFFIGKSVGSRYFNGCISEMRIWTKALSANEVANNICYVDPTTDGLLAYWRFNEGQGSAIKDWTGHGWDLNASGASWVEGVRCPN